MSHELRQPEFSDELLSAYLDGELTDAERMSVDQRLATDEASRRLLEELAKVSRSVRSLPVEPLGESVATEVVAAAHRLESATPVMLAERAAIKPTVTVGRSYRGWIYAAVAVAAALLVAYLPMLQVNERNVADRSVAGRERRSKAEAPRPERSSRDIVAADELHPVPPAGMGGMGGGMGGGALAGRPVEALMENREGHLEIDHARDANVYFVRVKLSPQAAKAMHVEQAILRNSIEFVASTPTRRIPPVGERPYGAAPGQTVVDRNDSAAQTRSPSEGPKQIQPTDGVAGRQRISPPQAGRSTTPSQLIAIEAPLTQAGGLLRELSEDASGILTLEVEPLDSNAAELRQWNRSAPSPLAEKARGQQGEEPPLADRYEVEVKKGPSIASLEGRLAEGGWEPSPEPLAGSTPSVPPIAADGDRVEVRSRQAGVDVPSVSVASPDTERDEKDEAAATAVATDSVRQGDSTASPATLARVAPRMVFRRDL